MVDEGLLAPQSGCRNHRPHEAQQKCREHRLREHAFAGGMRRFKLRHCWQLAITHQIRRRIRHVVPIWRASAGIHDTSQHHPRTKLPVLTVRLCVSFGPIARATACAFGSWYPLFAAHHLSTHDSWLVASLGTLNRIRLLAPCASDSDGDHSGNKVRDDPGTRHSMPIAVPASVSSLQKITANWFLQLSRFPIFRFFRFPVLRTFDFDQQ